MKTIYNKLLLLVLLFPLSILAQSTFSGTVLEKSSNLPLPGVNIMIEGTSNGTSTDFDGKFSLNVTKGDKIVFSYIGYKNYTLVYDTQKDISILLEEDSAQLDEVVVIGYGTVKKKDATGSLTTVTSDQFNRGPLVSADQLIQGKVSGLQVINGGGAPGEGAQIRIRSGSSLTASNDPLYVVDGVPLENGGGGVQGGRNPLSVINQNDIESVTVLKDASATAIYGSRASNGVIIITTKKGKSGEMKVSYNGNYSVAQIDKYVDVLSAKQYSDYVNANGSASQIALLGTSNTDWQKEIYRTALSTDHNVAFSGGVDNVSYRASVGYSDLNGILKKDNFQRVTLNVNLLGNFFDRHLKVEFTNKTMSNKNNYSERGAIGAAVSFDPTQQVLDDTYGYDYFQWTGADILPGDGVPDQEVNAGRNPVSLINQKTNRGTQFRNIGNIQFDYKLHFLPEVKAVANFGYDYSSGKGFGSTDSNYVVFGERNSNYNNLEQKKNQVMDLYVNYNKTISAIKTNIDFTGGYNYQNFNYINSSFTNDVVNNVVIPGAASDETVNLQSIFARAIFSINDKYLITGSIRRDGSSRFTKQNRWSNFPSVALAWKMSEESIFKDSKVLSNLKLRGSWGITGQQEIDRRYPSIPLYLNSTETASYQIGYDASGVPIYIQPTRPQPYNENLKWEETKQVNIGLDFGFFNDRITGTAEVYQKNSNDLIVFTSNPQGVGFSNADFYNIGDMEFKGIELSLDVYPVKTETVKWRVGGNITFQDAEVTKLNLIPSADSEGINQGGIAGATGNTIQNHQVGFSPFSFYVFEQVYDVNGAAVEGVYVDRNKDGQINEDDLYRYKKPAADFFYGFNTDFQYKNFDFSMSWRGSYGNYNYNNVYSNSGNAATALPSNGNYLRNASTNLFDTKFQDAQFLSDYYVQDASFVRLDNVSLGYAFPNALGEGKSVRISGGVQNVFIITKYKGIDPEISGGIDNNLYPRPRTYTLGLSLNF